MSTLSALAARSESRLLSSVVVLGTSSRNGYPREPKTNLWSRRGHSRVVQKRRLNYVVKGWPWPWWLSTAYPSHRIYVAHLPGRTSEPACRRDSVHRLIAGCVAIHLSGPPGGIDRASRPLLDLAPGGVCRAAQVAPGAGAPLPHRFTHACGEPQRGCPSAVCFLWHFPAGRPDWPLTSTPALRSPDLPRPSRTWPRPPGRLTRRDHCTPAAVRFSTASSCRRQ